MNKKLIAALFAGAFAFVSVSAMADDKSPPLPYDQAKLKAERDAARAKWAAMTPEEKTAARRAMREKKVSELSTLEIVGTENDNNPLLDTDASQDQAKFKAERVAAKARWDAMTPEQKAATRAAARSKKLSELTMVEKMSVGQ
jgi:hypothetical protein